MAYVKFEIAEVIDVTKSQLGDDKENLYSFKVALYDSPTPQNDIDVRPASFNMQTPPLVGELILIFNGPNQYSGASRNEQQWYYLCTLPIHSSMFQNQLKGAADIQEKRINDTKKLKAEFDYSESETVSKIVQPLQPFSGDMLLQGRFGGTLRFGSSLSKIDQNKTFLSPSWPGSPTNNKLITDPIITLSNTIEQKADEKNPFGRSYTIENLHKDASSLWLTTSQQLPTLKLTGTTDKSGGYNKYTKPQLVGVADRVMFVAKENSIILDAKKRVNLNAEEVLLGGDDADMPLVKGHPLFNLLQELISAMRAGMAGSGAVFSEPTINAFNHIKKAEDLLPDILNNNCLMKIYPKKNN